MIASEIFPCSTDNGCLDRGLDAEAKPLFLLAKDLTWCFLKIRHPFQWTMEECFTNVWQGDITMKHPPASSGALVLRSSHIIWATESEDVG